MNIDELNKEMFALENDFQQISKQIANTNDINFQPIKDKFETTQIKRPTKTGDHRNDINDKMSFMNTTIFLPEENKTLSNTMPQFSRNNSSYINKQPNQYQQQVQNNQQQEQYIRKSTQQANPQSNQQSNQFANYYSKNYDTLQSNYEANNTYIQDNTFLDDNFLNKSLSSKYQDITENGVQNNMMQNNMAHKSNTYLDTHTNGMPLLNAKNMYSINPSDNNSSNNLSNNLPNKINNSGFHKIDEKKMDFRQNMNSKIDNMIFDNPNAVYSNPILNQPNINGPTKDTRMVIQESSKDYYRQSANDRMTQYSPLSRASNMPINMASMSVNDFYSNMYNDFKINQSIQQTNSQMPYVPIQNTNTKDTLNNRLNEYSPLAKNIQYNVQKQNTVQNSIQNQQQQYQKPIWNPTDINGKLKNVVYNELPVISNSEYK